MLQVFRQDSALCSDIDRYFESDVTIVPPSANNNADWFFKWCHTYRTEYPCMSSAARDYLAVPGSQVAVERLFNGRRDVLGLRKHSMSTETMRVLMLSKDIYSHW